MPGLNYLHGLPKGVKLAGHGRQGSDVLLPDTLDIDEERMSVWVPFADGQRRDGVGDLLEIGGIRTERHRMNPIVLFDHGKIVQLPIGLSEDPETHEYTVELDPEQKKGRGLAFFYQGTGAFPAMRGGEAASASLYDHALFCEQLFDLLVRRYVRAGSIGYQVIRAQQLPPDYETGLPQGLHLMQTLLLEYSLVVMPANMDTVMGKHPGQKGLPLSGPSREDMVRRILSMPRICGKAPGKYLVKSLAPYATPGAAQLGWEPGRVGTKAHGFPKPGTTERVAVPRGDDHSSTSIPPVHWKPGCGASKGMHPALDTRAIERAVESHNWDRLRQLVVDRLQLLGSQDSDQEADDLVEDAQRLAAVAGPSDAAGRLIDSLEQEFRGEYKSLDLGEIRRKYRRSRKGLPPEQQEPEPEPVDEMATLRHKYRKSATNRARRQRHALARKAYKALGLARGKGLSGLAEIRRKYGGTAKPKPKKGKPTFHLDPAVRAKYARGKRRKAWHKDLEGGSAGGGGDEGGEGRGWHKGMPSNDISPAKARQILRDGEAQGHPLTAKQQRMFGAAAGKRLRRR